MNKIYFVRHGETYWNRLGKYQGLSDIELNEKGLEQAKCCAKALENVKFKKIITSDLKRAFMTAEYIMTYHDEAEFIVDKRVREINFGDWEGKTYNEISTLWPGMIEAMYDNAATVNIPGGESFGDVQARAFASLKEHIATTADGENILIVCHGGTIRTLICAVLNIDLKHAWNFRQGNTAISILEYYGEGNFNTLALLNDTKHIDDLAGGNLCG